MVKLMKTLALALIALGLAVAPPAAAQIVNGDFEAGLEGWRVPPVPGYNVAAVPGANGGLALRIMWPEEGSRPGARAFAAVGQTFDAAPYRGRRVTVSFRARALRPSEQIGLALRVDRPPGGSPGFFDNMGDRPIRDAEWRTYEVSGFVAPDALRIYAGLLVSGAGAAEFDDVRLSFRDAAPSAEALAYLDRALELLRQHHYRSAGADWTRITSDARAAALGAESPPETYPAIRVAIAALGERHTRLSPPAATATGPARDPAMPVVTRDGGVGIARLPGLRGGDPNGPAGRYVAILSDGVAAHARAGGCGWIVDLRQNGGGNMWPMLEGLSPLLGDPPLGWFIAPGGNTSPWVRAPDGRPVPGARRPINPDQPRQAAAQPIAVLLGPHTGSSGEMTAIALIGRDRVRSFGQPTAGLSTANATFPLPDGAVLVITTANAADRTGFQYEGPILPDQPTPLDAAEAAALRWLSDQGCKAAS